MFQGATVAALAVGYTSLLFLLAWAGDALRRPDVADSGRPLTYALSLAVFCTSWTFFGSVGLAAQTGYDFLPVYLGPILLFSLGRPLVSNVVRLAKSHNITSVADFLAARYGKSELVAAVVTVFAVLGTLPYIALQLKAVSVSIETLLGGSPLIAVELPRFGFADTAMVITAGLALFTILFGTRHIDATEHQDGLMLAIAAESLVKLAAFIAVGLFVVFVLFDGPAQLWQKASDAALVQQAFGQGFNGPKWLTVTFLSFSAALLLPRQFHVAVVENNSEADIRLAAWMFPLYLILINLFVVPIAAAGLLLLPPPGVDPDQYVLQLPILGNAPVLAIGAFIGGLSAATAMVIVETVALSIMVCNGLVVPLLLRHRFATGDSGEDMTRELLVIRRVAIGMIMVLAYFVFRTFGHSQGLATIGLISFAAAAQLAPAFFFGLVWRGATAAGAIAGIAAGFAGWLYTLVLPEACKAGWLPISLLDEGPFGISLLRPQNLLGGELDPLTNGVVWSIALNVAAFFVVSLLRAPRPIERIQAHVFIGSSRANAQGGPVSRLLQTSITNRDLINTVARYLGPDRAERAFAEFAAAMNFPNSVSAEADIQTIRFAEHLLASAIGAASARLVLSLLLRRGNVSGHATQKLLDDASEALQYNRDLLQSALDQVRHGLCVFDKDMRLVCWNRQYHELLGLPAELARVGVPLDRILRHCAERGDYGPGSVPELVAGRLMKLAVTRETHQEHMENGRRILEIRTSAMPQGGVVATYSDITDRVTAALDLARANESLERRVHERTAELEMANSALGIAKAEADQANLDKTRFLAAASHDILQPLNAARLYASSLNERPLTPVDAKLAQNVDAALVAVEDIFSALIEISKMDAGRIEPDFVDLALADIFQQMQLEFAPLAQAKGLKLKVVDTNLWVRSDRLLLKRVLQNLVANAVKYTRSGKVMLAARRRGGEVAISVYDTGPGIPRDKQEIIFKEFQRLEGSGSNVRGVGLGLSIVERITKILGIGLSLASTAGRGSAFTVRLPRAEPQAIQPVRAAAAAPGNFAGLSVLCIDNEPAVLAGMDALLTGWGCKTRLAPSTAKALALYGDGSPRPDVILADFHLDCGTGIEAIAALRKHFEHEIPAIIITADPSQDVHKYVRGFGVAVLRKPLKAAALRAVMAQYRLGPRTQTAAE
jgi:Na+/proline symporter/signal transduction histidine kinase